MTRENVTRVLVVPTPSCCSLSKNSLDRKVLRETRRIGSEHDAEIEIYEANAFIPEQLYTFYRRVREQKPTVWRRVQNEPSYLAKVFPLVLVDDEVIWTGVEPIGALDGSITSRLARNRHPGT